MPSQPLTAESFTTFGELLKYLRRRERLTQLELSIAVGYSEAQITRLEKNQRLPDLAAVKALFIPALHLENETELSTRLLALAQAARQEDAPVAGIAPYKGLLFFDEADVDLFFGREELTARLVERVSALATDESLRFLTVVGASGSGKSSLVRAGLAVTLKQRGWHTHIITPTAQPLTRIDALLNSLPSPADTTPILILVDQFEETFTLCHDEAQRIAFIDKLLALATPPQPSPAWGGSRDLAGEQTVPPQAGGRLGGGVGAVVITLRADFYAHCAQYNALRAAVAAQQEYIGQMTTTELRRAITEPAKRGGWEFEAGLVDRLLHDIGAHDGGAPEPGALPLLSHALLATWERRRGRTFTLDGYQATGGVRRAIAETAESVFTDQLDERQQALAHGLFLRLTELGEGTEDTRRRAALTELVHQSTEVVQLRTVLNTLAEARLVTLNADSAEVAHEALIREWQRLHEWLTQDREGLRLHRQLTAAAREWAALGHDADALYRGARLAQAQEWAAANASRLNEAERAFLAAAVEQETHEALAREAQRQRELVAAQQLAEEQAQRAAEQSRTAQQLRRRAYGLSGAFVLVALLAGVAFFLGRQATVNATNAEAARQTALVREVAASAINSLATDPERSILLALQAVKLSTAGDKPVLVEAADALHRAVQSSRLLATLRSSGASLWSVAVSRDGTQLATIGLDGRATVWDLTTNKVLLTLPTNVTENLFGTGALFSADGKGLLTISGKHSATLWDLVTGAALVTLHGHTALVTSVAISPDGKTLATASDDKTIKLWDAATGAEIATLTGHEGGALVLAFSSNNQRLFAGSDETGIALAWEITTGQELFRFSGQGAIIGVDSIAASPDGTRLATGEFDATVKIWDAQVVTGTTNLLLTLFGHASQVVSVAYSPNGKVLASAGEDGSIKLWDALTGRELLTLSGHTSGVMGVTFSADGQRLYSASRDGTVRSWDLSPGAGSEWFNLADHTDRVYGVAYRPDGAQLATWSWDGTVKVWDAADGHVLLTLNHENTVNGGNASYSPDGKLLAIISGKTATVFDAQSGAERFTLPAFMREAIEVRFSPDGTRLALASKDGTVRISDRATGNQLNEFSTVLGDSDGQLWQIAFSPDGQRLASANSDGVHLWDVATGKKLLTFTGHGEGVRTSGVTFRADGKWVASAGNDAAVRVWDAATGAELFVLTGHTASAFGVAFSPDGQTLATSSVDRTIKIWQLPATGAPVAEPLTLQGNTGAIYRVAFSPDGRQLAAVGRNPVARVYALPIADLVAIAQARVTRLLTKEECQKFLHVDECPSNP